VVVGVLARYFAALTLVLASGISCEDVPEGGDLTIWGPTTELRIFPLDGSGSDLFQIQHELKVTINNFSVDATGGDIDDFAVTCEMFSADALGGKLDSHGRQTAHGLSVKAFNTTSTILDFRYQRFDQISGNLFFDCLVDPENLVPEIDEENNRFRFLFQAYCIGEPIQCPGPVQSGPGLSFEPAA
jgi:hypothetical protein